MGALKQFLTSDVIVTPFEVNKGFTFTESEFSSPLVGIDKFVATNKSFDEFQDVTGNNNDVYQSLIYKSIKQSYYSNYLSSSLGDSLHTSSIYPGSSPDGDVVVGDSNSSGRFYNYLSNSTSSLREFPTNFGDQLAVISIPTKVIGDYIQPKSFIWEDNTLGVNLTDDGEGNIISGSAKIGNLIYEHGIITLTTGEFSGGIPLIQTLSSTNVTCSLSSSYRIFETQYKCTVRESEYNYSSNPTTTTGSEGILSNFATSSFFTPYVTSIGLYDESQNLLAVGKLSQPYPLSNTTNTSFILNLDK